jgi:hypothetical protein
MENNGFMVQICEDIHVALQQESQYWVPSFVHTGVPLDLALELQDIFENEAIYGDSAEPDSYSASRSEAWYTDEDTSGIIDLTLDD